MLKRNSINGHCKFGVRQKWELASRIGEFGNVLNGFAKSPQLIVLNIDWVQFVLKNCEILHSVRSLYDKQYCFTSDVMYKKYKRLVYTPSDLLARICKVNLSNAKKFGLICFPRICFRGCLVPRCLSFDKNVRAEEGGKEPLWLLNVIEDDYYFLGVHIRLSTASKMFHSKIT